MANKYRIPDFRKLYPEADEEVIAVLETTERKIKYQSYDLKTERIIYDRDGQTAISIQSREDSYERLLEQGNQFKENDPSAEEQAMQNIESERLHKALSFLSDDERGLILQLYFLERTEREVAEIMGVFHNAVHKRKQRILGKLKNN